MTLGLLGGTFDPFHVGHVDVARAALDAVGLDEVWIVPARMPPHRRTPHASAAHRFAMAALGVAAEPRFRVSDLEMDREGPSYTVDTLDGFLASDAAVGHRVFFIIGADAFRDIAQWRAFPNVLDRCHFVVVSRPGVAATSLPPLLPAVRDRMVTTPSPIPARPSVLLVDTPTAPVSSTEVRRAHREGRPLTDLVPAAVADYIQRQRLYVGATETPHA